MIQKSTQTRFLQETGFVCLHLVKICDVTDFENKIQQLGMKPTTPCLISTTVEIILNWNQLV